MKQIFIFIGGMVAGALLLYLILYANSNRTENSDKVQLGQQLIETISHKLTGLNQEVEVQYVEVKGKKGNVTLYIGMSKDSVQILLGKSDNVMLYTVGNSTRETWGYKIKGKSLSDLSIHFVNGKLEGVSQN